MSSKTARHETKSDKKNILRWAKILKFVFLTYFGGAILQLYFWRQKEIPVITTMATAKKNK